MSVLENFKMLSQIPRGSGNEEGIRNFLVNWANEHNLENVVDSIGNVIIYCPATEGYEDVQPICLQGHMDMVCVKTADSTHDFMKDPITLVQKGDWIYADKTTLGADNGIALAMIMEIFTDSEFKHGPLEALCTVNEEIGLVGAFGLDPKNIKSRQLVNLDSEEEGIIYVGCAGGVDVVGEFEGKRSDIDSTWLSYKLTIKGLKSGHSGADIHLPRANAIKLATRILSKISEKSPMRLVSFNAGTKRNAIPANAEVIFCIPQSKAQKVFDLINQMTENLYNEHREEKEMQMEINRVLAQKAFSKKDSISVLNALYLAPHGVQAMSTTLKDTVQTSANLAIVETNENKIKIMTSVRSSVESQRDAVAKKMKIALETCGAVTDNNQEKYPAWTPNPNSKLAKLAKDAYKAFSGKNPQIKAIHAGLECGIINSKIDGMDSISIGPDLKDVHTTNEHFSLSSAQRTLEFIKHLISQIKEAK